MDYFESKLQQKFDITVLRIVNHHYITIPFRSDCEELLYSCLEDDVNDVKRVCSTILTKENQTGCISVRDYLSKPTNVIAIRKDEGRL